MHATLRFRACNGGAQARCADSRLSVTLTPMNRTTLTLALASAVALTLSLDAQTRRPAAARPSPAKPTAAATPKTERPVPFRAGEVLTYDVSWSSYVTAGTATFTVKEKKPSFGSTAYYVIAEGKPTPLLSKLYSIYYKADSLLDAYSLLPQRGSVYSDENGRKRIKTTSFNQGAKSATYEVQTATLVKKPVSIAPFTQDALSAIYVLRAIPLKPGGSMAMPVSDSGKMYKVQVKVGSVEPVKTALGTINAVRVSPTITDMAGKPQNTRGLALWISDDARRLPVKMQAEVAVGSFNLTLREAR